MAQIKAADAIARLSVSAMPMPPARRSSNIFFFALRLPRDRFNAVYADVRLMERAALGRWESSIQRRLAELSDSTLSKPGQH